MIRPAILAAALALAAASAHAAPASLCVDAQIPRARIEAQRGRWITVTANQWNFLRGVFVLNPNTPQGMPPGDRAVLAQIDGKDGALVFFLDGDKACTPMALPKALVEMLLDVETIPHEGVEQ